MCSNLDEILFLECVGSLGCGMTLSVQMLCASAYARSPLISAAPAN